MVASTWITPGCVQFLKNKKRFHTAWVNHVIFGDADDFRSTPMNGHLQSLSPCLKGADCVEKVLFR
jgi:hypothetical protein